MKERKIIVAIGGSSGSIYAQRLMQKLKSMHSLTVGVVMTKNALLNWQIEIGEFVQADYPFTFYGENDFFAPFASGSAKYDTMIVCPSSMGLIGRMAAGISNNLITRAADVILKERRQLIVVPREAPYNSIHLQNMTTLTQAGAIICPATPSFYSKPATIEAVVDTVVDRVIDLANLELDTYRWGEN